MLYPELHEQSPLLSQATLAIAIFGDLARRGLVHGDLWGLRLVSTGLYTVTGYALIGLWLLGLAYLALQNHSLPHGLAVFGLIIGVILAFGLVAIPGIFRGMDYNTYEITV